MNIYNNQTVITLDEEQKVISFTKRRVKKECNHKQVTICEEKNTITCNDCNSELNPISWVIGHMDKINSAIQRANNKLAEVRTIQQKLEKKSSFMCKHCHSMNNIDFNRLPSKAAIARNLAVVKADGDEYRIEDQ